MACKSRSPSSGQLMKTGPSDGGWGWVCVLGRFLCMFFALGMGNAFGVIYTELIEYFNTTRNEAAWVGSLNTGLLYLSGPVGSIMISRLGIQKTVAAGTLLAFSGCFISWFANGIPYLYASYGIMLGTGCGIIFTSSSVILVQYFVKRRGFAIASSSAGGSLGALILPPLYTVLLEEYEWRGTLLIVSGLILNCLPCAVVFIPPTRQKVSEDTTGKKTPEQPLYNTTCQFFGLLRNKRFSVFVATVTVAQFGFFVPKVHYPDMALQIGLQKYQAANLVSIMGVSSIVGRIILAFVSDLPCVNVVYLQGVVMVLCGAVTIVTPHLTEFYTLALAAVLLGAGLGIFTAIISVIVTDIVGVNRAGDAIGMSSFTRGIMNLLSSPTAGWLFDLTMTYHASFYLSGCTFLLAGIINVLGEWLHGYQSRKDSEVEVSKA